MTKNFINSTLSVTNRIIGYTLLKGIAINNSITLKIFLIIHGIGMISEFLADVYFVVKGEPDKMGSFNLTGDYFYKPFGKILTNFLNERYSYNISENFGTDFYNTGMLTLSITQLRQAGMQHINKLSSQGINLYFSFKVRHTQFSHYGFTIEVVENTKFPIFNSIF